MKIEIEPKYEIIDDEEVAIWKIYNQDGTLLVNLDLALNEGISECYWIDESRQFIIVEYYDWDTNELTAIVNRSGQIIRKGIYSIEEYLEKYKLFIIIIAGLGLADEAFEYNLAYDDTKMAVINQFGDFQIFPYYDVVTFDEDENLFHARNYGSEREFKFSPTEE
jgi:hypothetical protein